MAANGRWSTDPGIEGPTVRDSAAQMAAVLILEPIFEADFMDTSFEFRPGRSAHQALAVVQANLMSGRREV